MHGRVSSAPDPGSPCPFWTKPANPRRLVIDDDGYVSSCSYPYPLRFAHIRGRFSESARDVFIQVRWHIPEFEEASLHLRQRRQQRIRLAVDLDHAHAD